WQNSTGQDGKDSLDLTEDDDGKLSATWTGSVKLTGRRTGRDTAELTGQTANRSYELSATTDGKVLRPKYLATRLDTGGSYNGTATLTREGAGESASSGRPLFNGRDLTGWVLYNCPRGAWEISGGELRTNGNDGRNGWLLTEAEYSDFELCLEF